MKTPTLTTKSLAKIDKAFKPLIPKGGEWEWSPIVQKVPPFEGQNQQYKLEGIGEDHRVLALQFKNQHDHKMIVVLATNKKTYGNPRTAKFLNYFDRSDASWWPKNMTVAVQK